MIGPVEEAVAKAKELMAATAAKDDKSSSASAKRSDDYVDAATVQKEVEAERAWLAEQKKKAATTFAGLDEDTQKGAVLAVLGLADSGSVNQESLKAFLADPEGFKAKAEAASKAWQAAAVESS